MKHLTIPVCWNALFLVMSYGIFILDAGSTKLSDPFHCFYFSSFINKQDIFFTYILLIPQTQCVVLFSLLTNDYIIQHQKSVDILAFLFEIFTKYK